MKCWTRTSKRKQAVCLLLPFHVLLITNCFCTDFSYRSQHADLVICKDFNSSNSIISNDSNEFVSNMKSIHLKSLELWGNSVANVVGIEECIQFLNDTSNFYYPSPMSIVVISDDVQKLVTVVIKLAEFLNSWYLLRVKHFLWLPHLLVIWPKDFNSSELSLQENSIRSEFLKNESQIKEIPLDSLIFFVTFSSKTNHCKKNMEDVDFEQMTLWEMYHANSYFILHPIQQASREESNNNFLNIASRRNFNQAPVRIAGVTSPEKVYDVNIKRWNSTAVEFIGGFSVEMMWDLRDSLNFTVIGVVTDAFTSRSFNGTKIEYTGIGRQIFDGQVDLSISLHTFLLYRAEYISFLPPLHLERNHAFFRQPDSSITGSIFIIPFDLDLWLSIFLILILFAISLNFMDRFLQEEDRTLELKISKVDTEKWRWEEKVTEKDQSAGFIDTLFWSLAVFSLQGWSLAYHSESKRIVFICMLFLSLILYITYSACIISYLARAISPISSFVGIVNYGYALVATKSIQKFYAAIPEKMESSKLLYDSTKYFVNESDTIFKMFTSDDPFVATVDSIDSFYYTVEHSNYSTPQICQISRIHLGTAQEVLAMIVRKGTHFEEFLSVKTILIRERGLRHHHESRYHQKTIPSCPSLNDKKSTFTELKFSECSLVFQIIFLASISSMIILVGEIILFRRIRDDRVDNFFDSRGFIE